MSSHLQQLQRIDTGVCEYYHRLGCVNYLDSNGRGPFLQFIIREELDDPECIIENELGEHSNSNDCQYSHINIKGDYSFDFGYILPLPVYAYAIIQNTIQKEQYVYDLLKYIFEHGAAPTDKFIQQKLMPKIVQQRQQELKELTEDTELTQPSEHQFLHNNLIISEDGQMANHTNSMRYKSVDLKMNRIQKIISPLTNESISTTQLASIYTCNGAVMHNDLLTRQMVRYYNVNEFNLKWQKSFQHKFYEVIKTLAHYEFDEKQFGEAEHMQAIFVLQKDRWLYSLNEQIADIYNDESCNFSLDCNVRLVQDYFKAFIEVAVNSRAARHCLLVLKVSPQVNTKQIQASKLINKFNESISNEGKTIHSDDTVVWIINISKPDDKLQILNIGNGKQLLKDECKNEISDKEFKNNYENNHLFHLAKIKKFCADEKEKINDEDKIIALAIHEFPECESSKMAATKMYLHYMQSVTRFQIEDLASKWFIMLFKDKQLALTKSQIKKYFDEKFVELDPKLSTMNKYLTIKVSQLEIVREYLNQFEGDQPIIYRSLPSITKSKQNFCTRSNIITGSIKKLQAMTKCTAEVLLYLFYYVDIMLAMQAADNGMNIFVIEKGFRKYGYISLFYHSTLNKERFYGVIKRSSDEYTWKLNGFLNEKQIANSYNINSNDLPIASNKNICVLDELKAATHFNASDLIDQIDWTHIKQIKSKNTNNSKIAFTQDEWIKCCKNSFDSDDFPLFPVIVNTKLEWIKLIYIRSRDIYTAISCHYKAITNEWDVTGIILDNVILKSKNVFLGAFSNNTIYDKKRFYQLISQISLQTITFKSNDAMNLEKLNEQIYDLELIKEIPKHGKYPGAETACTLGSIILPKSAAKISKVIKTYCDISISKKLTKEIIPNSIIEIFTDVFRYMIKIITIYKFEAITQCNVIRIINFKFHNKSNATLYVVCNKRFHSDNKIYWRTLDRLFSAIEIKKKYGIGDNKLPKTEVLPPRFVKKLQDKQQLLAILQDATKRRDIISNTKFENPQKVPIYGSKRADVISAIKMKKNEFVNRVNDATDNTDDILLIPIIICKKQQCSLEHALIVPLNTAISCCDIAISFKLNTRNNLPEISAICLDITDSQYLIPEKYTCKSYNMLNFRSMDQLEIGQSTKVILHKLKQQNQSLKQKNQSLNKEIESLKQKNQCWEQKYLLLEQKYRKVIQTMSPENTDSSNRDATSSLNANANSFTPKTCSKANLSTIVEETLYSDSLVVCWYVRQTTDINIPPEILKICIKFYHVPNTSNAKQ